MAKYANLLPSLSKDEFEALKADIERNGVLHPVLVDEDGNVLDGRHRLMISPDAPKKVIQGLSDTEKRAFVYRSNFARRNLSPEQRAELQGEMKRLAAEFRQQGRTQADIAAELGVSRETVRDWLISNGGSANPYTVDCRLSLSPEQRGDIIQRAESGETQTSIAADLKISQARVSQIVAEGREPPDATKPHVANNSGNNEWYTPPEYISAARLVMGGIDLDPASSEIANETVGAAVFYSAEQDGLSQDWRGRVWMNPPYSRELIGRFCDRLRESYECGDVTAAVVLVNNSTESSWFQELAGGCSALCFPARRVRFLRPQGNTGAPLQGQVVLYMGDQGQLFTNVFSEFGFCVVPSSPT